MVKQKNNSPERVGDSKLESSKIIRKEASIKAIRDLILENPKKVLTVKDFQEAAGTTRANVYVTELIEEGTVIRHQVKDGQQGHRYNYEWNEPIVLDIPPLPLTDEEYKVLYDLSQQYIDSHSGNILDEYVVGVILFRQWLKDKLDDAKRKRKTAVLAATKNK